MRIAFFAHNLGEDNGGGVLARHVLLGLRESLGAEVTPITTVPSDVPGERAVLYPNRWRLFRVLGAARALIRPCDVLHVHDVYPYGVIAFLASMGLRKKMVLNAVGTGSILPLYHPLQSFFARMVFRRADRVLAISQFVKQEILKKIPTLFVDVINPGIDVKKLQAGGYSSEIKSRLVPLQPYILGVGALRKRKGYERSLQAFARLAPRFPNLNYVIVGKRGSQAYFHTLKNLAEELKIGERVFFFDTVEGKDELYTIYRNAELFCLLSQNEGHDVEGFGIVFLEAAAFGLPVVGTKGCGIDDAVRNGENGILVAEDDVSGFSHAIDVILSDPKKKKQMGERSRILAAQSDWEKKIKEYQVLYKKLFHGA